MDILTETDRIKDRLRTCTSAKEINAVADEERATVKEIAATEDGKPLAKQISNMKVWLLGILAEQQKRGAI